MIRYIRKLEEQIQLAERSLVSKARTDTLDDLRLKAGEITGMRAALQLAQQENKETLNG